MMYVHGLLLFVTFCITNRRILFPLMSDEEVLVTKKKSNENQKLTKISLQTINKVLCDKCSDYTVLNGKQQKKNKENSKDK